MNMYNPPHAGLVLTAYLDGISITDAAKHLGVTRVALSRIVNAKAGISTKMALRLAILLNTSPNYWLNLQIQYNLWKAEQASNVIPLDITLA